MNEALKAFAFGPNFRKWVQTFYGSSMSAVLNNGYTSNWFKLERSVRQGCPLAAFLFVLTVELMAIAIRRDQTICGISSGTFNVKISQLADDTTCFLADEKSGYNLIKLLNDFSKLSGLKCNADKTEAIWIGKNYDNPPGTLPVKWVQGCFRCLGLTFTLDETEMACENLRSKLQNFKKTLNMLKMRDLTLIGRILVAKSLALSQITYVLTNCHIPVAYISDIQAIVNDFIWKGSTHKVKMNIISQSIQNGGLKYPQLAIQEKALKLSFVRRLLSPDKKPWKESFQAFIKTITIHDLFKTRCIVMDNTLINIPLVYKDLVSYWSELKAQDKPVNANHIYNECIWFNPFITIDGKTLFYKKWYTVGIKYISDILDPNGLLLTDQALKDKFNFECNFLEYYGLRNAIPKVWRTTLSTDIVVAPADVPSTANTTPKRELSTNNIYWRLLDAPAGSTQATKWVEQYKLDLEDWGAICHLPYKCCFETKLQSFQYTILYKFVPYKEKIHKMGLVKSAVCDYCTGIDSIAHRFVCCPVIKVFWKHFISWWDIHDDMSIHLNEENIILGLFMINNYALNKCILLAKYFIHKQKCIKGIISFSIFKRQLKQNVAMEKFILVKHNKQYVYEERWAHIVGSLT